MVNDYWSKKINSRLVLWFKFSAQLFHGLHLWCARQPPLKVPLHTYQEYFVAQKAETYQGTFFSRLAFFAWMTLFTKYIGEKSILKQFYNGLCELHAVLHINKSRIVFKNIFDILKKTTKKPKLKWSATYLYWLNSNSLFSDPCFTVLQGMAEDLLSEFSAIHEATVYWILARSQDNGSGTEPIKVCRINVREGAIELLNNIDATD